MIIYRLSAEGYWIGPTETIADDAPVPAGWVASGVVPSPGGGEVALAVGGAWENVTAPGPDALVIKVVAEINWWADYWTAFHDFQALSRSWASRPASIGLVLGAAAIAQAAIDGGGGLAGDFDWHPGIAEYTLPDSTNASVQIDAPDMLLLRLGLLTLLKYMHEQRQDYMQRAAVAYYATDLADLEAMRLELPLEASWTA